MADKQPIVVKRKKKAAGDGHHGGQWKVAYADFTTAMMAFFLILWLLNAVTEEQMVGIANYFSPSAASNSESGSGGVLGGMSMVAPGPMARSMSQAGPTVSQLPLSPEEIPDDDGVPTEKPTEKPTEALSEQSARELMAEIEQREFDRVEAALRAAIEASPELSELSENLIIEMTPEGMRIQIVDLDRRSMFPSGSSTPYDYTEHLLAKIAQAISGLQNKVAVIGHTDATPYPSGNGYTNWDLSTDRANASRRTLVASGLSGERLVRVSGKADHEPLIEDDPFSPQNRRISILLLRRTSPTGTDKT
jgi:chemotaxis protein MotB